VEVWRDIVESKFTVLYSVSNYGRVKRNAHSTEVLFMSKTPSVRNYEERICKQYIAAEFNYYPTVLLYDRSRLRAVARSVHSLVAKAFLEKLPHHQCVNHKDCNKENNHVDNLEWTTIRENTKHAYDNGLFTTEKARAASLTRGPVNRKQVYQYAKDGTFVMSFNSLSEAAELFGGNRNHISKACEGKLETYKKYIWSYELL
jgi:hypothetical protein